MRARDHSTPALEQRLSTQRPQSRAGPIQKANIIQSLELTYVATHMVPPVVLHCLNILTIGQYSTAGWFSAHQLVMAVLTYLSPYIPLSRYQLYALRLPFNIVIAVFFWKVVGFAQFRLTQQSAVVAAFTGVISTLLWVGGPKTVFFGKSKRRPWNPYSKHEGHTVHLLVVIRLLNSTVFTPFFEEVYDRGFLYRALFNLLSGWQYTSFEAISLTAKSVPCLAAAVLCFGAGHTRFAFEPVLGMLFAVCMHGLVFYFDSLGPAVLAHAVCNLLLGLWVVCTEDWMFW